MKTNEIRKTFLDYFAKKGHTVVPSMSLVPNDPSLLFTNAGMNQFKDVFLGKETRSYTRATSVQCCMRASDIENVGFTSRHHTFFEMLGNFSFGDYFKREAINYAWEFLTQVLKIPQEKLSVTVFEEDEEAEKIWLNEIKVDPKRVSRSGAKDNFWSMGDTGPCGPCSEIFYDHGEKIKNKDDRYVEIWNLVFMQYNRAPDGSLTPLPKPSVDTGMGLERIAAVMQNTYDNYETDIFQILIKEILTLTKVKDSTNTSVRIIADHIRAASFLIANGVMPSNEGRGYVLRKIIRRAIRHANKLYIKEAFFYKLAPILVKEMGETYPKLIKNQKLIERTLYQEEQQFNFTLQQGLKILEQEIVKLKGEIIPGDIVFRLYDTYGFPSELTSDIAREHNLSVDKQGLNEEMLKQKIKSRQSDQFKVDYTKIPQLSGSTKFVGYEQQTCESKIIGLFKDSKPTKKLQLGEQGIVVLEITPFYAEAGGQAADTGEIYTDKALFQVQDTQKQGAIYLHYGEVKKGILSVNNKINAKVNSKRKDITLNHSATHLLHAALREILGSHVEQKGSLVNADRLRFDFSQPEALTQEQLKAIEIIVNQKIRANLPVSRAIMTLQEAKQKGAIALFDEKYTEQVCVVKMGDFTTELCGGTHVKATGEIGLFKIISEGAIAAGIRRIEAITGATAFSYFQELETRLKNMAILLKTDINKIAIKLNQTLDLNKQQEKELSKLKDIVASTKSSDLEAQAVDVEGIKVIAAELKNVDTKTMRSTIDNLREKLGSSVILLANLKDKEIQVIAGVTKDCISRLPANDLIQYIVEQIDGKGGGRADMAQGCGTNVDKLGEALSQVKQWVFNKLH